MCILTVHAIHMPCHNERMCAKLNGQEKCWRALYCDHFLWIKQSWTFGDPHVSINRSLSNTDYCFVCFGKKWKNLCVRRLKFFPHAPSNSALLSSLLAVWGFQMPLSGLSYIEGMTVSGIINATDPLTQNTTEIVCICWLINTFNEKPWR